MLIIEEVKRSEKLRELPLDIDEERLRVRLKGITPPKNLNCKALHDAIIYWHVYVGSLWICIWTRNPCSTLKPPPLQGYRSKTASHKRRPQRCKQNIPNLAHHWFYCGDQRFGHSYWSHPHPCRTSRGANLGCCEPQFIWRSSNDYAILPSQETVSLTHRCICQGEKGRKNKRVKVGREYSSVTWPVYLSTKM